MLEGLGKKWRALVGRPTGTEHNEKMAELYPDGVPSSPANDLIRNTPPPVTVLTAAPTGDSHANSPSLTRGVGSQNFYWPAIGNKGDGSKE